MSKKTLNVDGIAPNLLIKDIEVTAPFLFQGEVSVKETGRGYLKKIIEAKKNLKNLKFMNLSEYFELCLSAHWATAGTYVPTNVDNQIREGLWRHQEIQGHIEKMGKLTLESFRWDYSPMTNRKLRLTETGEYLSTHEGTWLSVAIGAYCALKKHKKHELQEQVAELIVYEIKKEEKLLLDFLKRNDVASFLQCAALMAHNLGDLDRVIDQWKMPEDDPFRLKIYKLGHRIHPGYSEIFYFAGAVNKALVAQENHRHMSLRMAKCLRTSKDFLVPLGPYMEEWGEILGASQLLTFEEKAEILTAFFEGYKRQDLANGYIRGARGMIGKLPDGLVSLERYLAFDFMKEMKSSPFYEKMQIPREEFHESMVKRFNDFKQTFMDAEARPFSIF